MILYSVIKFYYIRARYTRILVEGSHVTHCYIMQQIILHKSPLHKNFGRGKSRHTYIYIYIYIIIYNIYICGNHDIVLTMIATKKEEIPELCPKAITYQ